MKPASFNLIVRDNLEQTQDDFGRSDVRTFQETSVTCGTAAGCACRVPGDPESEAARWFEIAAGGRTGFTVTALDGAGVFHNQDKTPLSAPRELLSGDNLRVAHYTFRFQRVRKRTGGKRRIDVLSLTAKVILALIFLFEVGLVYGLPRKLKNSRRMARTVLAQRTFDEVDLLRKKIHRNADRSERSMPSLTRAVLAEELTQLAHYIRQNENRLDVHQWRGIRSNISRFELLLELAEENRLGASIPAFERDQAVRKILEKHNVSL